MLLLVNIGDLNGSTYASSVLKSKGCSRPFVVIYPSTTFPREDSGILICTIAGLPSGSNIIGYDVSSRTVTPFFNVIPVTCRGFDTGKSIHLLSNYDNVDANFDLLIRSRLSLNFDTSNATLGKQLVMLYSSTEMNNSQFISENRFKVIHVAGSGKFKPNNSTGDSRQPHVILTTRLGGIDYDSTGLYNLHIKDTNSNSNYIDPFSFSGSSSSSSSSSGSSGSSSSGY